MPKKSIHLNTIKAKELMHPLDTVPSDTFIGKVIRRHLLENIRALAVLQQDRFTGIIKGEDLIRPVVDLFTKGKIQSVSQCLSLEPPRLSPNASLFEVLQSMATHRSPELLIMDRERFYGIIRAEDLVYFFAKILSEE